MESSWKTSIISRCGEIGRGSSGAAHRPSPADTNFFDNVSNNGRQRKRLSSSVSRDDGRTLARKDLKSCFPSGDTSLRRISTSFPTVILNEETIIAFTTPCTDGGLTNEPSTVGCWLIKVGYSLIMITPSFFKTFANASLRQSSLRHFTTTREGWQSRAKITVVCDMLSGINGSFPRRRILSVVAKCFCMYPHRFSIHSLGGWLRLLSSGYHRTLSPLFQLDGSPYQRKAATTSSFRNRNCVWPIVSNKKVHKNCETNSWGF